MGKFSSIFRLGYHLNFLYGFIFLANSPFNQAWGAQGALTEEAAQQVENVVNVVNNESPLYSMKDLEILYQEKNYREFFLHARDIRPSHRNDYWKNMVNEMGEHYAKEWLSAKIVPEETFLYLKELMNFPQLKENDLFLQHRGQLGKNYFHHCVQEAAKNLLVNSPPHPNSLAVGGTTALSESIKPSKKTLASCIKAAKEFWEVHPKDPYLGVELAELFLAAWPEVDLNDLWPLLSKATQFEFSTFLCQRPLVTKALLSYLERSYQDHLIQSAPSTSFLAKLLSQTVNNDCWKELKPSLEKILLSGEGPHQKLAYELLKSKKELQPKLRDYYLSLYIIQGPVQGETFNEAWNNLKSLHQSHQKRMTTIELLSQLDPLPGNIFKSADEKKKKVILDYFHQNFPEYMDYYARTCVDYLSGNKKFENGNPTPYCSDLFQAAKKEYWVDEHLKESYLRLKKF